MKKYQKLAFMLFVFLTVQNVWGQDSLKQEFYPVLRKNVLRLDGGLGYERLVWQSGKHKIGVSAFGITQKADFTDQQLNLSYSHRLYNFGTGAHYFYGKRNQHLELSLHYSYGSSVVLEGEWLSGENLPWNEYRVYGGYSSHYHVRKVGTLRDDPEVQRMIEEKQDFEIDNRAYQFYRSHNAALRIGYRYQRVNGGFFFRIGVSFANLVWYNDATPARFTIIGTTKNTFENIALPYIGIGWSF